MANSAAMTVIAAATTTGFQPKIGCSPDLMITTSTSLKPTNVNNVPISGSSRRRNPNWARDWIICGNPSTGPWVAWDAMNRVPNAIPAMPATMLHYSDSPGLGRTKLSASVNGWKFPTNQNGA